MILSKEVYITLNSSNISYYEDLGYIIPRKIDKWNRFRVPKGTKINVSISHLPLNSHSKIEYICDFCKSKNEKPYSKYNEQLNRSNVKLDCCGSVICQSKKREMVMQIKYGVSHPIQHESIKNKIERTNIRKYGYKNVLNNKEIKKKASDKRKKSHDVFVNEVRELYDEKFIVKGQYVNSNTPIEIYCTKCNKSFHPKPSNFTKGQKSGCFNCNTPLKSKCEDTIESIFINKNLIYTKQYRMGISEKRFDFHINGLLIEYDGVQHFEAIPYFKGVEGFQYRLNNDKIKNQYCIDNNISLIRIPYWEKDNIEYILENVLAYFNIHRLNNKIDREIVERYLVDSNWNHDTYLSWHHKENRYWLNGGDIIEEQIYI